MLTWFHAVCTRLIWNPKFLKSRDWTQSGRTMYWHAFFHVASKLSSTNYYITIANHQLMPTGDHQKQVSNKYTRNFYETKDLALTFVPKGPDGWLISSISFPWWNVIQQISAENIQKNNQYCIYNTKKTFIMNETIKTHLKLSFKLFTLMTSCNWHYILNFLNHISFKHILSTKTNIKTNKTLSHPNPCTITTKRMLRLLITAQIHIQNTRNLGFGAYQIRY